MFKSRLQQIALIISVIFHLLLLAVYRPLAQIRILPSLDDSDSIQPTQPIVFDLVETPDDAIQRKPESANLLSDKNAIARDLYQANDKPTGEAYSEGQLQYKVFAGSPDASSSTAQPLVQEQQVEPVEENSDEREQDSQSDGDIIYKASSKSPRQKFDKTLLTQSAPGRRTAQQRFSDDLNYDQQKFNAEALGGVTLNTYAWDFAPYILAMKRKIKENIYPPPAFMQMGVIAGETVLRFKVMPDGSSRDIKLVSYSGHKSLMETSLTAVKNASPFRPLPKDFPEENLELTWTFIYSITR